MEYRRPCTMPQQRSDVGVSSFTQAKLSYATTSSSLPWNQAEPCRKLPPRAERGGIADRRYGGGCRQQSNAGDVCNTSAFGAESELVREALQQRRNIFADRPHAGPLFATSCRRAWRADAPKALRLQTPIFRLLNVTRQRRALPSTTLPIYVRGRPQASHSMTCVSGAKSLGVSRDVSAYLRASVRLSVLFVKACNCAGVDPTMAESANRFPLRFAYSSATYRRPFLLA